jgi:hypothetical protein
VDLDDGVFDVDQRELDGSVRFSRGARPANRVRNRDATGSS